MTTHRTLKGSQIQHDLLSKGSLTTNEYVYWMYGLKISCNLKLFYEDLIEQYVIQDFYFNDLFFTFVPRNN